MNRRVLVTMSGAPLPAATSNDEEGKGGGGGGKKAAAKLTDLLADNDELQEQFDAIIEKRVARERRNSGNKGRRQEDLDLEKELEDLRTFKTQQEQTEAEKKTEYEKALGIEREKFGTKEAAWKKREDVLATELRKERVRGRLISAAQKAGAIDPEDVADMLEKRVGLDEEFRVVIRDAKDGSKTAINADGDDMTLDELVDELLARKTHLARPAEGDGAGARGGSQTSAEGAGRATARGKQTGEIADLQKIFDTARAAAEKNSTPALLTKMQQAKRALENAQKKAA